jgi:pantothenate kinase type III
MLLAIDVGNTNTAFALHRDDELRLGEGYSRIWCSEREAAYPR